MIDIYRYIALHDSVEKVAYVLERLESLCSRLTELPERGHTPPELDRIGVANHREVHFKPYRVVHEVIRQEVFVQCTLHRFRFGGKGSGENRDGGDIRKTSSIPHETMKNRFSLHNSRRARSDQPLCEYEVEGD